MRQQIPARELMPFRPGQRLRLPGALASPQAISAEAAPSLSRDLAEDAARAGLSVTVGRTVQEEVALYPFGLQVPGAPGFLIQLAGLSAVLGVALVTFTLFPGHLRRWAAVLDTSPVGWLRALLLGLVGYLGLAALSFLIGVTVVGLPLVWLLAGAALTLSVGGMISVALALGGGLAKRLHLSPLSPWWALVAGCAVLVALAALPVIGWLVFGGVLLAGFGAGLLSRFGHPAAWQADLAPPGLDDT